MRKKWFGIFQNCLKPLSFRPQNCNISNRITFIKHNRKPKEKEDLLKAAIK